MFYLKKFFMILTIERLYKKLIIYKYTNNKIGILIKRKYISIIVKFNGSQQLLNFINLFQNKTVNVFGLFL